MKPELGELLLLLSCYNRLWSKIDEFNAFKSNVYLWFI